MRLTLVTGPTVEPLHLDEAKNHLRVESDSTADDALIQACVIAARETIEGQLGRCLVAQTFDGVLDRFPREIELTMPRPPLRSVTHVKYYDADGTLQTWASSKYQVSAPDGPTARSGRIVPVTGETWPLARVDQIDNVQIRFVAGYGTDWNSVPQAIRAAVLLMVGELYERREAGSAVAIIANRTYGALLSRYVVDTF